MTALDDLYEKKRKQRQSESDVTVTKPSQVAAAVNKDNATTNTVQQKQTSASALDQLLEQRKVAKTKQPITQPAAQPAQVTTPPPTTAAPQAQSNPLSQLTKSITDIVKKLVPSLAGQAAKIQAETSPATVATTVAQAAIAAPTATSPVGMTTQAARSIFDTIASLNRGQDESGRFNIKETGKAVASGAKMLPGQVQQAGGIISQGLVSQNRAVNEFFSKHPTVEKAAMAVLPFGSGGAIKVSKTFRENDQLSAIQEKGRTNIENKGKELAEAGTQKMAEQAAEYEKNKKPSTGVQKYAELVAFNLPQMAVTTGLTLATAVLTKNPQLAATVGLSTSYGLGASEVYNQARQFGLSNEDALPLAQVGGAIIGAIDFLPVGRLLEKSGVAEPIKQSLIRTFASEIISIGTQAGFEGVTESLQEIVGNALARTYDENQDLFQGTKEAFITAMITGGLADVTLSGSMSVLGNKATPTQITEEIESRIQKAFDTPAEERSEEQKQLVASIQGGTGNQILTPDQVRVQVEGTQIAQTPAAEVLNRVADQAESEGKAIAVDPTGQVGEKIETPEGNIVAVSVTDALPQVQELVEQGSDASIPQEQSIGSEEIGATTTSPQGLVETKPDQETTSQEEKASVRVPYEPDTSLPKDMSAIEKKFGKYLNEKFDEAETEYQKRFGNVLNTDNARELSEDYNADRNTRSRAVHEPASTFITQLFAKQLQESPPAGRENTVLFTAGGTGAGKTTAINTLPEFKTTADEAQIVYDTNLSSYDSSKQKVDQALSAGKTVEIIYVSRDPVKSMLEGAVPRANRMGRTVPLDIHVDTHVKSLATIQRLATEYAGNDAVGITVIDNNYGKGQAKEISLDTLKSLAYNRDEIKQSLQAELKKLYDAGEISKSVYEGFTGTSTKVSGVEKKESKTSPSDAERSDQQSPKISESSPITVMSTDELIKLVTKGGYRTDEEIAALRQSIKENGITYPIEIVEEKDGTFTINDGNHRIQIAKDLGITSIPVKVVPKFIPKEPTKITNQELEERTPEQLAKVTEPKTKDIPRKPGFSRFQERLEEQLLDSNGEKYSWDDTKKTYDKISLKEDAEKATTLLQKNPERALLIAKGLESPKASDPTLFNIMNAIALKAFDEGNVALGTQMINKVSLTGTRYGQNIATLRGNFNNNTPQSFIKQVIDDRLEKFGKTRLTEVEKLIGRGKSAKTKATAAIDLEVTKLKTKVDKQMQLKSDKIKMAQSIIESLKCT